VLSDAAVPVSRVALHLLAPAMPIDEPPPPDRPVLALPAADLAPLAGVYALNPSFKLTVSVRGTQVFAQATGQAEFELFASAPRRFFARVTPLEVQFDGDAGPPAALVLTQGGQTTRWARER
jgi:serine-type D-Ala-D-Ala carboxypeptidase/endopeptidase